MYKIYIIRIKPSNPKEDIQKESKGEYVDACVCTDSSIQEAHCYVHTYLFVARHEVFASVHATLT